APLRIAFFITTSPILCSDYPLSPLERRAPRAAATPPRSARATPDLQEAGIRDSKCHDALLPRRSAGQQHYSDSDGAQPPTVIDRASRRARSEADPDADRNLVERRALGTHRLPVRFDESVHPAELEVQAGAEVEAELVIAVGNFGHIRLEVEEADATGQVGT